MKKFLLPLVATTLLLTGCSGSGKLDLPSGGTEVDITKTEEIAKRCAKTTKATLEAASSGVSASLNLNGDVKLNYVQKSGETTKTYKVNVTGFNADVTLTTGRVFGMYMDEVDASLSIKNLKGKIDVETENFSMQYELQPVELNVYLQDGVVYADASNSNLKAALPVFLKKIAMFKDYTDEQINAFIEQYIGANRKAYYDASEKLSEVYIEDIPTWVTQKEVIESVKEFLDKMAKAVTLKDFLTVKTYEDSRWGFKVAANKAGVQTIIEKVTSKEQAEAIMKDVTTAEATVVALTDKYSRLSSIEAEAAFVASVDGSSTDSKLGGKLSFDYDAVVEFPSDLDTYKEVKFSK